MTYQTKDPILRAHYLYFRDGDGAVHAHSRKSRGGSSNAYCVAYETGRMPRWAAPGTLAYAAARAGQDRRTRENT